MTKRTLKRLRRLPLFLVLLGAVVAVGCRSLNKNEAASFQKSVTEFRSSMAEVIDSTDQRVSDFQLDLVMQQEPPPLLEPDDFAPVIGAQTKAALLSQIDALKDYADLLRSLSDKEYRGSFGTAVNNLANQASASLNTVNELANGRIADQSTIQDVEKGLKLFSTIASQVGESAIDAYAQSRALAIVKAHHAEVASYCAALQRIIHPSASFANSPPVASLAFITWQTADADLSLVAARFAGFTNAPANQDASFIANKRAVAKRYQTQLKAAQSDLNALFALRKACGGIASAHEALATDDKLSFYGYLAQAQDCLNQASRLIREFKTIDK